MAAAKHKEVLHGIMGVLCCCQVSRVLRALNADGQTALVASLYSQHVLTMGSPRTLLPVLSNALVTVLSPMATTVGQSRYAERADDWPGG